VSIVDCLSTELQQFELPVMLDTLYEYVIAVLLPYAVMYA